MAQGYLALVLHAHLPYVRHPESETYLEERWLFEAITETYIPLLDVYHRLLHDEVDFRVTMSITPTLLSMLTDPLLKRRYFKHLESLIELASKEVERTADQPAFHVLATAYLERFRRCREVFLRYGGNLVQAFRGLQELGKLEIITSAATHAFLPLVQTEAAVRAQLLTAVRLHEQHFGRRPRGIWLPECGYAPGLDELLKSCGFQFFFVDAHGVGNATPAPIFGTMSPVLTPAGVAALARDEESSKQVWSAQEGYPGDYDYREYYRDIGYDLPFDYMKPHLHPDGIRVNTGIKYYRITGPDGHKEPYNSEWAREKAAQHAGNFLFNREQQVAHWQGQMGRPPLIVAPYDAELFGHWWHEGPMWLDFLLRKMHFDQATVKTITPSEYLALHQDYQVCRLPMSSWGRQGYADVWLRGENDWIYPALHELERQMIELADRFSAPTALERRALNQAARELLLAQSSDWAFIMDAQTMVDYAVKRTKQHVNRFHRLATMLRDGQVDDAWLGQVEQLDQLFPAMEYADYRTPHPVVTGSDDPDTRRVLMLSWEFPPQMVGGLSRHVYDLARYLVPAGWEVHVLTAEQEGAPAYEQLEGVHVHRVPVHKPDGCEFEHWVCQLNVAMIEAANALLAAGLRFALIHAHDWLVGQAGRALQAEHSLPLVVTIHATEHGRNQGIHTELQQRIHAQEVQLTAEAQRVIVCSAAMQREAEQVLHVPTERLSVLPNGVDPAMLAPQPRTDHEGGQKTPWASPDERIVMFVGRLVHEKGVQTLLAAAPAILAAHGDVKFVIAGRGPALSSLQEQAQAVGVAERVVFAGFITDAARNQLFAAAEAAVFPSLYEPFGIVALEAMAAGTPVVAAEVGGLRDVVRHGENGLCVYANDPQSIAQQVIALLDDPALGQRLADTARAELARYDWRAIAEQTVAIYDRVAPTPVVR